MSQMSGTAAAGVLGAPPTSSTDATSTTTNGTAKATRAFTLIIVTMTSSPT
jgi:hypothetical protein